jgi:hypothetical protein
MNNAILSSGRWLFGCLLAAVLGFFVGYSQEHARARPGNPDSRIQWPADLWSRR